MQRLILSSGVIIGLTHAALAAELATFRATYDFVPSRIFKSSASEPIDGKIIYEMSGSACMGYTIDSTFTSRFADGASGIRIVDLIQKTFEGPEARTLNVEQSQTVNGREVDLSQIKLQRDAMGAKAQALQSGAKTDRFEIEANVLFPTAQQLKLLSLAAKGETRDVSVVYDGSDGPKVYDVVTFISKKRVANSYRPDLTNPAAAQLRGLDSWSFQLGYYTHGSNVDDLPDFQSSYNMYENGVTTEILFDYGAYRLKGKLVKYEVLPPLPCTAIK